MKPNKKSPGKGLFRRVNDWLHLWLGLVSGIIVVIISITGAIYAFEREIKEFTSPYLFVEARNQPYLAPSVLKARAEAVLFPNRKTGDSTQLYGIVYNPPGRAAEAGYSIPKDGEEFEYFQVYLNPYTGEVLKRQSYSDGFFAFILEGHFYLWLPHKIGQPVVATATLVFVALLISGLIMWWPKNLKKSNVDKSFKVKWGAGFKRVNYDLHNVFGFYVMTIALILALTGLVWGFEWFSKSVYWATSGGKILPEHKHPDSDTTLAGTTSALATADKIWFDLAKKTNSNEALGIYFALDHISPVEGIINHRPGTYYNQDFFHYDQYTGKELDAHDIYAGTYASAPAYDKLRRMNYDIHVGAVLGLAGKFLAFSVSLVCASLPITGFLIWWGRRKKQNPAKRPRGSGKTRTTSGQHLPVSK